jgi:hypothetical protein
MGRTLEEVLGALDKMSEALENPILDAAMSPPRAGHWRSEASAGEKTSVSS